MTAIGSPHLSTLRGLYLLRLGCKERVNIYICPLPVPWDKFAKISMMVFSNSIRYGRTFEIEIQKPSGTSLTHPKAPCPAASKRRKRL